MRFGIDTADFQRAKPSRSPISVLKPWSKALVDVYQEYFGHDSLPTNRYTIDLKENGENQFNIIHKGKTRMERKIKTHIEIIKTPRNICQMLKPVGA